MTFDPKEFLRIRGRRVSATIMSTLEAVVWDQISDEDRKKIRSAVLSTIGEYQDLAMDLVSSEAGSINEFWVDELAKLHRELRKVNARD